MPKLTVKIVNAGTLVYSPEKNKYVPSKTGHMWYSLEDDQGQSYSYGYAPVEEGDSYGPGRINPRGSDDENYLADFSQDSGDYQRFFEISQEAFDNMKHFGENAVADNLFDDTYFGLLNSCIDFVWEALEYGGFKTNGFEGDIWPTNNIDNIKSLPSQNPNDSKILISEDGELFVIDKDNQATVKIFGLSNEISDDQIHSSASTANKLGIDNILIQDIEGVNIDSYQIKPGDSISKIANDLNISQEDLIKSNPWLEDQGRISNDKSYILIKPGEKLTIPKEQLTNNFSIINQVDNSKYLLNIDEDLINYFDNDNGWNSTNLTDYKLEFDFDATVKEAIFPNLNDLSKIDNGLLDLKIEISDDQTVISDHSDAWQNGSAIAGDGLERQSLSPSKAWTKWLQKQPKWLFLVNSGHERMRIPGNLAN